MHPFPKTSLPQPITMKFQMLIMQAYVWFITVGPHFFFALFYGLYFADAMGDTSDLHCVVDLASAGKMVKPVPLDYKAAGIATDGLEEFIKKNPQRYEDVTEKYRSLMLFGTIVQAILFVLSVYQSITFKPAIDDQANNSQKFISFGLGVASLTQIIMTLVARCSTAGEICAGDYLPDVPMKEYQKYMPYYEKDDGKFLFVTPIVQLCLVPILCCLTLFTVPMIMLWAIQSESQ